MRLNVMAVDLLLAFICNELELPGISELSASEAQRTKGCLVCYCEMLAALLELQHLMPWERECAGLSTLLNTTF